MDLLPLLAVLACPIGMGLMMLFMSKGMKGKQPERSARSSQPSLDDLRSEQAEISAKIEQLENSERANGTKMAQHA